MKQAGQQFGRQSANALMREIRSVAFAAPLKQPPSSEAKRKGVHFDATTIQSNRQDVDPQISNNLFKATSVPYILVCYHGRSVFRVCKDCGRTKTSIRRSLASGQLPVKK